MKAIGQRVVKNWLVLLPFCSSLLLVLPFAHYNLSFLVYFALIPYLFFLKFEREKPKPKLVLITWLMGLFFSLFVTGWFVGADTASWLKISGIALQLAIFTIWMLMGLALSAGFLLVGLGVNYFSKRLSFYLLAVGVLPALWVITEFVRSCLVSVIATGKGGSIGPYFNFGSLGYAATATPLGFSSRILGLYGMSAVAVLINVAVFWALEKKYRMALLLTISICTLSVLARYLPEGRKQPLRIGTVQLDTESVSYYDELAVKLRESGQNGNKPLDVLVLPEYSLFLESGNQTQRKTIESLAFGSKQGALVYTTHGPDIGGLQTNETVVANENEQIISRQEKSFLIPTGEYIPWIISAGLKLTGQQKLVDYFQQHVAVAKSPAAEQPVDVNDHKLGILACSGAITPTGYRRMARAGAGALINTASLIQFKDAPWYHQQARQFARFQAVANERPFIQSARGGYSFIIDDNGNFVQNINHQGVGFAAATVKTPNVRTPYTLLGEWTVGVSVLMLVWTGLKFKR